MNTRTGVAYRAVATGELPGPGMPKATVARKTGEADPPAVRLVTLPFMDR